MQLLEVRYSDKPPRFFIDGKRVSRGTWETVLTEARMYGKHDCFLTQAKPLPGGKFKRFNYSNVRLNK